MVLLWLADCSRGRQRQYSRPPARASCRPTSATCPRYTGAAPALLAWLSADASALHSALTKTSGTLGWPGFASQHITLSTCQAMAPKALKQCIGSRPILTNALLAVQAPPGQPDCNVSYTKTVTTTTMEPSGNVSHVEHFTWFVPCADAPALPPADSPDPATVTRTTSLVARPQAGHTGAAPLPQDAVMLSILACCIECAVCSQCASHLEP